MAQSNGANFGGGDPAKLASGTRHDAGIRLFENKFDLESDDDAAGGTSNTLLVAKIREGCKISHGGYLSSTANLSGINFTLGTAADPDKYATAFAGPAANATVTIPVLPAMLAADPLSTPEDLILTPSGNLPAAGTVVAAVTAAKR